MKTDAMRVSESFECTHCGTGGTVVFHVEVKLDGNLDAPDEPTPCASCGWINTVQFVAYGTVTGCEQPEIDIRKLRVFGWVGFHYDEDFWERVRQYRKLSARAADPGHRQVRFFCMARSKAEVVRIATACDVRWVSALDMQPTANDFEVRMARAHPKQVFVKPLDDHKNGVVEALKVGNG